MARCRPCALQPLSFHSLALFHTASHQFYSSDMHIPTSPALLVVLSARSDCTTHGLPCPDLVPNPASVAIASTGFTPVCAVNRMHPQPAAETAQVTRGRRGHEAPTSGPDDQPSSRSLPPRAGVLHSRTTSDALSSGKRSPAPDGVGGARTGGCRRQAACSGHGSSSQGDAQRSSCPATTAPHLSRAQ